MIAGLLSSGTAMNPGSSGGIHTHGGLPLNGGMEEANTREGPEFGRRHESGEVGGELIVIGARVLNNI